MARRVWERPDCGHTKQNQTKRNDDMLEGQPLRGDTGPGVDPRGLGCRSCGGVWCTKQYYTKQC